VTGRDCRTKWRQALLEQAHIKLSSLVSDLLGARAGACGGCPVGSVAVVHACAFFVARAGAHPRGEMLSRRKGQSCGTDFGDELGRWIHAQAARPCSLIWLILHQGVRYEEHTVQRLPSNLRYRVELPNSQPANSAR
jgi:hypothetical protein